jgi:subtilisin family serine protease
VGSSAAAPGKSARTIRLGGALAVIAAVVLAVSLDRPTPTGETPAVEVTYVSEASLRAALVRHPAALIQDIPALRVAEVRPAGDATQYIRALRRVGGIVAARPAVARTEADAPGLTLGVVSTPAGGAYEWQWYATGVDRVPSSILAAAARTTIAIVDTGADLSAPTLAGKVRAAYDVRSGSRSVVDTSGHGTFVASIAGGSTSAGGAVAGFGGAARLLVVKVGDGTSVNDVDVAAGVVRSVQSGARIVNVSLAGRVRSAVEASAVTYAARHGVLVVAAAGNDALIGNPAEYPAALLRPVNSEGRGGLGLAVAASGLDGRRAGFSEHGPSLSLAAPGTTVFGALASTARASVFARAEPPGSPAGLYAFASGTSYAAPQVSGAAALVWAADPQLTAQQVAAVLEQTASGHGAWTPELGYGVIDVAAAVDLALRLAG